MDIADIVSEEYVAFTPETPVSKLVGTFDDPTVKGVVVRDDEFEGIVTRRQFLTSRHPPDQKAGSVVRHAPRVDPEENVRTVARLMIDGDTRLLPVFDDRELAGVVTADAILGKVTPFLDAATVADGYTADLVTIRPDSTVGEALHRFREQRITHLPVVADGTVVGILSLYDVTGLTVRPGDSSQGGDAGATDSFGGDVSAGAGRARRGGFGAREGDLTRVLDLPVRDVMVSPVRTIRPDETLETAAEGMFEIGGSSLVVTDNGSPYGIITKTDLLASLTWEAPGNRAVEVYGTVLLDDTTYDDVVAMIERFDDRDHDMTLIGAKVHLHEHDEKRRGTPLLLARLRLYTDRGMYIASGEGYGASHALNEARDSMERRIRDKKTHARSKKAPDEAFWKKRFGWMLEA